MNLSIQSAIAIAEALRQADPAAYASIVGELGLTPQTPSPPQQPQPRRVERDKFNVMKTMLEEQGEIKARTWRRRRGCISSAQAEAEPHSLVEKRLAEGVTVIGRGRPSRRVRRIEQPETPADVHKAIEFIERKGGVIDINDWRRRTKGKTAEEAFAELNPLVEIGLAQWREMPSTAGRVRREIYLV